MFRRLLIAAAVTAVPVLASSAAPSSAATSFTGRIVDSWSGDALSGATVIATDIEGLPIPGASDVTASDGSFTIGGLLDDEYLVRVDGRDIGYERGYVGVVGSQPFGKPVLQGIEEVITWEPQAMGKIGIDGRLFFGRVVNATTGAPLAGVTVAATDTEGVVLPDSAVLTDVLGRFRIGDDLGEEHGVRVDGNAIGRERGWLGVNESQPFGKPVLPTWGEVVTWSPGNTGAIGLDAMRAPFPPSRVQLSSNAKTALLLKATPSPNGDRTASYVVTCTDDQTSVTRVYSRSGVTQTGFPSGLDTCRVSARNAAGTSRPVTLKNVTVG